MKKIGIRVIAVLFIGAFAITAAWMSYRLYDMTYSVARAKLWVPVEARVISYNLDQHDSGTDISDNEISYAVRAEYEYVFRNVVHTGTLVDFSRSGGNNFTGDRQSRQMDMLSKGTVDVFVNPDNPAESVLDRSLPAEVCLFFLCFLVFPCFIAVLTAISFLIWPFRGLRPYAAHIGAIFYSIPALWLLYAHHADYGPVGKFMLSVISSFPAIALWSIIHAHKKRKGTSNK